MKGGGGGGGGGGRPRSSTADGTEVTTNFLLGAQRTLDLAIQQGVTIAILKQRSPSCGSREIYDGRFADRRVPAEGVTATLLRRNGIVVFDESQLMRAATLLAASDGDPD